MSILLTPVYLVILSAAKYLYSAQLLDPSYRQDDNSTNQLLYYSFNAHLFGAGAARGQ